MKLLILAVFCFGVNANKYQYDEKVVLRPGLAVLCGKSPVEKVIGPIEDNGKRSTRRRIAEFARKNGNALLENEDLVTDKSNYVYPCLKDDYECIRQFFGANCLCKPIYGPVTDPYCVAQHTAFLPSVNVSIIFTNVEFRGLSNATVHSFFYNKKTGFVVLSFELPTIILNTDKVCFEYHRPGEESIVKCDCITATYKKIILTAEFPGVPNCRLDLADVHAYAGDSRPIFTLGPNAYDSTNPQVQASFTALVENLPTVLKEFLLFVSHLLMSRLVQTIICFFDIEICSV